MHRLQLIETDDTPTPLPPRTAPAEDRLAAIFTQLDWWAETYTRLVVEA